MSKYWNEEGLTWKQFQFCQEYLQHYNAERAYKKIYSQKARSGSNVLKSKNVQRYLRKILDQKLKAAAITDEWLTNKLVQLINDEARDDIKDNLKTLQVHLKAIKDASARIKELENNSNDENININIAYEEQSKDDDS